MSTTVDNRVVEMSFDNSKFESNVQTSLRTLDRLNQSLDMTESAKKFSKIGDSIKAVSFDGLSSGVETIKLKFSALEVAAVTALSNITSSAINAGKRIASAFTIDPIKSGFQEYETQINAIQTILANTSSAGKTLDEVSAALDELNLYADKTIYNFTEMTKNIGTFTAAGVDLDTSVKAIKGIANLAAISGSTSQQASTAMYQLSQALAAGKVGLQDWNSVVNAGMGGKVFQDALKETARLMGKNVDESISFRDSLNAKNGETWLTSDVLLATLEKFTGDMTEAELATLGYTDAQVKGIMEMGKTANDAATKVKTFTQLFDTLKESAQSGWTSSWELIVGDFEEAKETLTEVSNVIGEQINASAEARNKILAEWKGLGGREDIIDSFWNIFDAISSIQKVIGEAMRSIFPPTTGKDLKNITAAIKEFTENLIPLPETVSNLRNTFKGLFAILDIGKQLFSAVWDAASRLFGVFGSLGGSVLALTGSWGQWLVKLDDTIRRTSFFHKLLEKVSDVIVHVYESAKNLVHGVLDSKVFNSAVEAISSVIESVKNLEIVDSIMNRIKTRFRQVQKVLGSLGDSFSEAFATMKNAIINSGIIAALQVIWDGITIFSSFVIDKLKQVGSAISDVMSNIDFSGTMDVASGLGIGAIALSIKNFIDTMSDAFDESDGIIGKLVGVVDSIGDTFGALQSKLKGEALVSIAKGIAIIAASAIALSLVNSDRLAVALGGLTALFVEVSAAMAFLDRSSIGVMNVAKASVGILAIGTSLLIMAGAIKMISSIDLSELENGLIGVGILLGEMSIFMKHANFEKDAGKHAVGMVLIAGSIRILSGAVAKFQDLDWGETARGLVAIGSLLGEVALFAKMTGDSSNVISTATALVILSGGLVVLSKAVEMLGSIPIDSLVNGLLSMGTALAIVALATTAMPENMIDKGVGLLALSGAMAVLSKVAESFGNMNLLQLAKGMAGLGGSMTVMAVGLKFMTTALPGAAALLVASGAIMSLVPSIVALSLIPIKGLFKSLGSLAVAFGILGTAGAILAPLVPVIMSLSASLLIISGAAVGVGAGLVLIGGGLTAIAAGFTAVVTAGAAGATAFVASMAVVLNGVAGLVENMAKAIADGLVTFLQVLAQSAPLIAEAVLSLTTTVVNTIVGATVMIAEAVLTLLDGILVSIAEHSPSILQSIFDIMVGILQVIADNMDDLVEAGIDIVLSLIEGITNKLPDIIQAGFDLLLGFVDGITNSITANKHRLVQSMLGLMWAVIDAAVTVVTDSISSFLKAGNDLMNSGLIQGVLDKASDFVSSIWDAVVEAKNNVVNKLGEWVNVGKNIVDGMVRGIKDGAWSIVNAAKEAARRALNAAEEFLGINSPSRAFAKVGMYSDQGFAKGLMDSAKVVSNAAIRVGKKALSGVENSMLKMNRTVSDSLNLNPTIRPVVDLSDVQNGIKSMNLLFSNGGPKIAVESVKRTGHVDRSISRHNRERYDMIDRNSTSSIIPKPVTISNTFHITGDNPREIAREVSKIMNNNVERKRLAWG